MAYSVVLASTSPIKIAAVKDAGYDIVAAVATPDDSRPSQPIYSDTLSSELIISRINAAVNNGKMPITLSRYWLIIENVAKIFEDKYYDSAFAVLFDTWTGLASVGISSNSVNIPQEYVNYYNKHISEKTKDWTFGRAAVEVEAALGHKVKHNDWFNGSLVTSPYPSRLYQIIDAIKHITDLSSKYTECSDIISKNGVYYPYYRNVTFYDVMPAFYSSFDVMKEQMVRVLFPYGLQPCFINDGGRVIIASIASRGHLVSTLISAVCYDYSIQIIPLFKAGAIPEPDTNMVSYRKEYGTDVLAIHKSIAADLRGKNVIIADDILASGGTVLAAIKLLQNAGANVKLAVFVKTIDKHRLKTLESIYTSGVRVATLIS